MKARPTNQGDIDSRKVRSFTIPVETMAKMERITQAIGIPKEQLALMLIRAKKRGLLEPKPTDSPVVIDTTTDRRARDRRQPSRELIP